VEIRLEKGRYFQDEVRVLLKETEHKYKRKQFLFDGKNAYSFPISDHGNVVQQRSSARGAFPSNTNSFLQVDLGIPEIGEPFSDSLKNLPVKVSGMEAVRHLRRYRLERDCEDALEDAHVNVWVSPERGFKQVRRAGSVRDREGTPAEVKEWHRITEVEEFSQYSDGIWLPSRVRSEHCRVQESGNNVWLSTAIFTAKQVEVNVPIGEEALVPPLPSGMLIVSPDGARQVIGDDTSALEDALKQGVLPPSVEGSSMEK